MALGKNHNERCSNAYFFKFNHNNIIAKFNSHNKNKSKNHKKNLRCYAPFLKNEIKKPYENNEFQIQRKLFVLRKI